MVNQQHLHYDRYGGWQPVKARKLEVLGFIYDRETVAAYDLVEQFGYTYSSARGRLCRLGKEGLTVPFGRGRWCLTQKAYDKLSYYGILKKKPDERLRIERQAEGRTWLIGPGGRMRTARNDSELAVAVTLNEALRIARELRKDNLI